jgi:hypothetical protein
MATAAEARRVALVIGQNAYRELLPLDNPVPDARRMAELLSKTASRVIACDDKTLGCFDLDRSSLLDALKSLESARREQASPLDTVELLQPTRPKRTDNF